MIEQSALNNYGCPKRLTEFPVNLIPTPQRLVVSQLAMKICFLEVSHRQCASRIIQQNKTASVTNSIPSIDRWHRMRSNWTYKSINPPTSLRIFPYLQHLRLKLYLLRVN